MKNGHLLVNDSRKRQHRSAGVHQSAKRKQSRNKTNFYLDLALTVLFVIEMEVYFTGLALHELMGLLFAVLLTP